MLSTLFAAKAQEQRAKTLSEPPATAQNKLSSQDQSAVASPAPQQTALASASAPARVSLPKTPSPTHGEIIPPHVLAAEARAASFSHSPPGRVRYRLEWWDIDRSRSSQVSATVVPSPQPSPTAKV